MIGNRLNGTRKTILCIDYPWCMLFAHDKDVSKHENKKIFDLVHRDNKHIKGKQHMRTLFALLLMFGLTQTIQAKNVKSEPCFNSMKPCTIFNQVERHKKH